MSARRKARRDIQEVPAFPSSEFIDTKPHWFEPRSRPNRFITGITATILALAFLPAAASAPVVITFAVGGGFGAFVDPAIAGPPGEDAWMTVCHLPPGHPEQAVELSITASAWPVHEAHGDAIGSCAGPQDSGTSSDPSPPAGPASAGNASGPEKVTICHFPPGNADAAHLIRIGVAAWPAHEAHGDQWDTCPAGDDGNGTDGGDDSDGNGTDGTDDPPGAADTPVCHVHGDGSFRTLYVNASAVPAHLAHGDTAGACDSSGGNRTLVIEDASGQEIGDLSLRSGQSLWMVAVLYENGTRIGPVNATWNTTGDLDAVPAGPSMNVTFVAQTIGTSGTVTASHNPVDATGTIKVIGGGGGGGGGGGDGGDVPDSGSEPVEVPEDPAPQPLRLRPDVPGGDDGDGGDAGGDGAGAGGADGQLGVPLFVPYDFDPQTAQNKAQGGPRADPGSAGHHLHQKQGGHHTHQDS